MKKSEGPRALLPKPLWSPWTVGNVEPPLPPSLESVGLTPGQACVAYGTFSLSPLLPGLVPKGEVLHVNPGSF